MTRLQQCSTTEKKKGCKLDYIFLSFAPLLNNSIVISTVRIIV